MIVREIIKIPKQDGWKDIDFNGSHIQYKHPIKPRS